MRVLIIGLTALFISPALAADPMPVARQNELVKTYCAVCHSGTANSGGLSLEHFDAAHVDPTLAMMLAAKINSAGAMGASGHRPDKDSELALLAALQMASGGADRWYSDAGENSVSIIRTAPADDPKQKDPDLYRLILRCDPTTHDASMQLAWSPGGPPVGAKFTAAWNDSTTHSYVVADRSAMMNGAMSGQGAQTLASGKDMALPAHSLTVTGLSGDARLVFPFGELPPAARKTLAACTSAG